MSYVLVCFGEGGHAVQADRFICGGVSFGHKFITVGDGSSRSCRADLFLVNPFPKSGGISVISLIRNIFRSLMYVLFFRFFKRSKLLISFGPGITIFLMLFWRASGGRLVFIETWSRFYSASSTGKLMYRFSSEFYIQNVELSEIYPGAKFRGRL